MDTIKIFITLLLFCAINLKNNSFASSEKIPDVLLKYNIQTINIDNKSYLAFNFENIPHWHTYWKNPGDAGFGPKFKFTAKKNNESIKFKDLERLLLLVISSRGIFGHMDMRVNILSFLSFEKL